MTDTDIIKAFDILDKFEFFGGQRAGRLLWYNKPQDVQDKDIGGFLRDIDFLKAFINHQKTEIEAYRHYYNECLKDLKNAHAEIERLEAMVGAAEDHFYPLPFKNMFDEYIEKSKSEAIKEFAERLKDAYPEGNRDAKCPAIYYDDYCYIIDELAEKMMGEESI